MRIEMIFMCDIEVKEEAIKLTFNSLLNFCQHYFVAPGKELCPTRAWRGTCRTVSWSMLLGWGLEAISTWARAFSGLFHPTIVAQLFSHGLWLHFIYRCLIKCYFMTYKVLIFTGSRILLCRWRKRISMNSLMRWRESLYGKGHRCLGRSLPTSPGICAGCFVN